MIYDIAWLCACASVTVLAIAVAVDIVRGDKND